MKHKGFYIKTDSGNVAHVLGDKNMTAETMTALKKMVDLAYNKKSNMKNGLWLVAEGEYVLLKIEVSKGEWVTLIKERLDSPFSHIIESSGISKALNEYNKPL